MNCENHIGLDVHQASISVAVTDSKGKVVMESILETKASNILEFFAGLRGTLSVTLVFVRDTALPRLVRVHFIRIRAHLGCIRTYNGSIEHAFQ